MPTQKISGDEGKIVPAPRIGQEPPAKERDPKAPESDLRKRNCLQEPCKEKEEKKSDESDLRKRICIDGPCVKCPPGQSAGKNGGCEATPTKTNVAENCPVGWNWNGSSCMLNNCPVGTLWDGFKCTSRNQECASFTARAATLENEIRNIRVQKDNECRQSPSSDDCMRLTQQYEGAVLEYRGLLNEAPVACRASLQDPLAF